MISASQWILHPNYGGVPGVYFDIALVELETPIDFDNEDSIAPICMPNHLFPNTGGQTITAVGWGRIDVTNFQTSQLLKEV